MTENGIEFESVDYTRAPLSVAELKELLHRAELNPQDALRKNEDAYQKHVANKHLSDEQLIRVMAAHPELIQRPLVTRGRKAVLARPTEKLSDLGIT